MKFPELTIENFLAITEAKINLADRGLVVIQGENHADTSATSNGSGKSSIPDALSWCWFGVTARGVTGDDVINDDAKKNCLVRSVVVDGHMTYTATRHRKHKTGKNTLTITAYDGLKTVDLTKGTDKLTQVVATQIIGSSLEVFVGSIYAGQEEMPDLPAMTDKHLKLLIEDAAGVTVLEGAYQKAREEALLSQKTLEQKVTVVATVEKEIGWIDSQIAEQHTYSGAWETNRKARVDTAKSEIGAVVPQLKKLQADLAPYDPVTLEAGIKAIDISIASVGAENTELVRLAGVASTAMAQLKVLTGQIEYAKKAVLAGKTKVQQVAHKIGCPCDSCGRPLTTDELAAATTAAEDDLTSLETNLKKLNEEELRTYQSLTAAQDAHDAFKLTMTDISSASAQRASLLAQLTSYRSLLAQQETTTFKAKGLRDQFTTLQAEANPHEAQIEKLEKGKVDLETKLETARKIRDEAITQVELDAAVVNVFGPAGVRARVLDEVTPFLNDQTAKYLSTLSDGNIEAVWTTLTKNAKGELREKFSIDVSNETGGKLFKGLSGGEKRKARLATALALQDLVATRASKPIELFIGDEIDDALDPAGLERLTMILEEKARDRGSVFVISHNELRDHIKQVLLIEKMPDKTTKITEMAA